MSVLLFDDGHHAAAAGRLLRRIPPIEGEPIRIQTVRGLCDRYGAVHAGGFLRERRIAFNCTRAEFPRIFVHEIFHFVWLCAGNPVRRSFEELLLGERSARARGELGWSAEWRKQELTASDAALRSRRWREYCCESFCDTAAWRYSGVKRHPEFTLATRFRNLRKLWFDESIGRKRLSI
jgi:hypothetical protein